MSKKGVVLGKIVAGVGAMIFGFVIVYDTQQIFGSASASFGGGKRDLEYTLDMYAAWKRSTFSGGSSGGSAFFQ